MRRGRVGPAAGVAAAWWAWRHWTSPAVRGWTPPSGRRVRAGPLSVRVAGAKSPVFVVLHGLTASGDTFGGGFDVLAEHGTLVAPDLLGFGQSLDVGRDDFSLEAHLDALDVMLDTLGVAQGPLVVVGHSMGAVLALHWAARRRCVQRVVAFSAPLYESEGEARRHISRMGPLEKFFALESPLAHWTCSTMCALRPAAQWLAVAISPAWPVQIARQGVLHTWPAYLGGMNGILLRPGWREAIEALSAREVPIVLANGADDPVPVAGLADELAAQLPYVRPVIHPEAGHDLPVSYEAWAGELVLGGTTPRCQARQTSG